MRHKWFQIDQPLRHERDRLGVCLHVPELEFEIDLAEGSMHEWILLEVLASNADDEDGASKSSGLDHNQ